jgi:uncharacterized protein YndB with AHSA1/START domain
MSNKITVETTVAAPIAKVWECWNGIEHISGWAFATDDWGAKAVENDVRVGGALTIKMFAKDGSASFDFKGTYMMVNPSELIEYDMEDGRQVKITFEETPEGVHIVETFDPENENPEEMQREGWQAFLDNFKKYVENK